MTAKGYFLPGGGIEDGKLLKRNDNRKLGGKTQSPLSLFIARFRSSRKIRNL